MKNLYRYGILAYLVLIVFAVIFYLERTAFVDPAFIFFKILATGKLAIQEYRFGSAVTQIIPLLGSKLHLPLKTIVISYSVWAVLYNLLCYVVCGNVFRRYDIALVLLLCNLLFIADSFYWLQTELPQGIPFMLVTFAWFSSSRYSTTPLAKYLTLTACLVIAAFFHPLMFIPASYLALFLWLRKEPAMTIRVLVFILVVLALSVFSKTFVFRSSYDSALLDKSGASLADVTGFFSFPSTRSFVAEWFRKYYWIPVVSLLIGAFYVKQKQVARLMLFCAAMGGYLVLVNTSFSAGMQPFHLENFYLPLAIFMAVPLVFDVLPIVPVRVAAVLFVLIVITGLIRIYSYHEKYTNRLHWAEHFLEQHRNGKWVYDKSRVPLDTVMLNWSTPYEFWMLSAIKHQRTASILVADNADNYIVDAFNRKDFLTTYESWPYEKLPSQYFLLTDTNSTYTVIRKSQ